MSSHIVVICRHCEYMVVYMYSGVVEVEGWGPWMEGVGEVCQSRYLRLSVLIVLC